MNLFLTSELLAQMDFYIAIVAPFSHQDFFDVEWRAFNIVRIHIYVFIQQKCMSLAIRKLNGCGSARVDILPYLQRKDCLLNKASNYQYRCLLFE